MSIIKILKISGSVKSVYIVNNAIQNIFRNRGRNILIAIIILAIITTTVVALIINNTAGRIIDDYKTRFGSEVTISPDREKMRAQMQQSVQGSSGGQPTRAMFNLSAVAIAPELYLDFGDSDLLKESVYSAQAGAVSDTLKAVDEEENSDMGSGTIIVNGKEVDASAFRMATMRVIGNSNLDTMTEFIEGLRAVDEGRIYEKPGECVVSNEFADLNGLNLGDEIEVQTAMAEESVTIKMTVVGIYSDLTDATNGMTGMRNAGSNRRNEILTSFETLINAGNMDSISNSGINITAKFYLKSPDLLDAYRAELAAKGLDMDTYIVSADEAGYNTVVAPVESLKGVTWTFLVIVLVLGAVILILLSTIAIRERKYEIGVLRAMGMKKGKVALGLLTEMIVITAICLAVGLGAGMIASQPVSDILLEQQVEAAQSNNNMNGNFGNVTSGGMIYNARMGGNPGSNVEALKEMEVGMTVATIIEIILISLLLAVTASVVGIVNVTRYEPMRILTERA